jgi:CBS domain-containing protein
MKKFKIKKLPVMSEKALVGVITITDIANARPEITRRFIDSWVKPRWED